MRSGLSSLVDNLSEIKNYEKCLDEKHLSKFVMLLRKGIYLYEYMDSWEIFNGTSLPSKKDFYSELILEDISDSDYEHAE